MKACCHWLDTGSLPPSLTETNIVLIPKCDEPIFMRDLPPISLCNVVYKVLSKVLANSLKAIMPECISKEQSTFVKGRAIKDNINTATEIIHYMRCKVKGKIGYIGMKIDIIKAYDRVGSGYLKSIMIKLGFADC